MSSIEYTDVAIIGGGFYGAFVANEVKSARPDLTVQILEKEAQPFTQASSTNQGQFHMGYMYSADRELAAECVENIAKFSGDFKEAIDYEVTSLYGIHDNSEISPEDYMNFCQDMGLPIRHVNPSGKIFSDAVSTVFETAEKTFNSAHVQRLLLQRLALNGVGLTTGFMANGIRETADGLQVVGHDRVVQASQIFNVTFADTNTLHDRSDLPKIPLQHDSFLHFVIDLPEEYRTTAATVIRGPYASLLPSSFREGHILASGVHRKIRSAMTDKPADNVGREEIQAVYAKAIQEAADYMPVLDLAAYRGYTLGTRSAHFNPETGSYTSKAIVFDNFGGLVGYHAVLGGKVSCMFDVTQPVKEIVSKF